MFWTSCRSMMWATTQLTIYHGQVFSLYNDIVPNLLITWSLIFLFSFSFIYTLLLAKMSQPYRLAKWVLATCRQYLCSAQYVLILKLRLKQWPLGQGFFKNDMPDWKMFRCNIDLTGHGQEGTSVWLQALDGLYFTVLVPLFTYNCRELLVTVHWIVWCSCFVVQSHILVFSWFVGCSGWWSKCWQNKCAGNDCTSQNFS